MNQPPQQPPPYQPPPQPPYMPPPNQPPWTPQRKKWEWWQIVLLIFGVFLGLGVLGVAVVFGLIAWACSK